MARIVQIDKLYDHYHHMTFGYAGVDLETGEIKYYSFYDHNDHYNSRILYEFDMNNLNGQYLPWHMKYCCYKRPSFSSQLSQKLRSAVDEVIDNHKKFNIENGFPTTNLDFNRKNLSIKSINVLNLFGTNNVCGVYIPVSNVVELINCDCDQECISSEELLQQNSVLIHEIGHMKVTKCDLDEKNNKLLVRIGFYNSEVALEPFELQNGDVFYKIENMPGKSINKEGRALEEVINDVECSIIFPSYIGNYPKFGKQLNELCDGKLLMARYTNGIDDYYSGLTNIINSEDLATELLGNLSESIYGSEPKRAEEKAMKLIKKYQNEKFK